MALKVPAGGSLMPLWDTGRFDVRQAELTERRRKFVVVQTDETEEEEINEVIRSDETRSEHKITD